MEPFSHNETANTHGGKLVRIKSLVMIVTFALLLFSVFAAFLLREEKAYSDAERRPLESAPKFSLQNVDNGSFFEDFEDYALDQFVFRDLLRSIKAIGSYYLLGKLDNNDLYYYDGALYKIEQADRDQMASSGAKIEALAQKYQEMNRYYSVIPDKNSLVFDRSGRLGIDMNEVKEILGQEVASAEYIDITDLLSVNNYYATDLHWRQETILPVADRLLSSMNNTYRATQDRFSQKSLNGFCGAYYGQAALPVGGEELIYLENDMLSQVTVTDLAMGTTLSLYDEEAFESLDPYNLFIGGPQPLLRVENPNAASDKKLYLFRDSFGSSLAPLLIGGYSEIYLIDIRYVMSDYLDLLVPFEAGNDMLFMYSTTILNQSAMLR